MVYLMEHSIKAIHEKEQAAANVPGATAEALGAPEKAEIIDQQKGESK